MELSGIIRMVCFMPTMQNKCEGEEMKRKRIDIRMVVCPFCKQEHESWGYEGLVSRFDEKLIRYSDHSCPKLSDLAKEHKKLIKTL